MGSLAVGAGANDQGGLGRGDVLVLAEPGLEAGLLEGAAVGEGERPGLGSGGVVDVIEGQRRLLLGHSTREEGDAGHGGGDGVLQHAHGGESNLTGVGLHGSLRAGADHVGLEEGALEHDVVVREGLVHGSEDALGGGGGHLDGEVAVHEHLGLDDGDKAVSLADGGVSGKGLGILVDGHKGGSGADGVLDVEHGSPLGEASALLVVLGAAGVKVVHALSDGLAVGTVEGLHTLVDLDTGNDALGLEDVNEGGAVVSVLVQGLLEQDDTGDVVLDALGLEEELAVLAAVVLVVLHLDLLEALANGASGLVRGKDALSGRGDGAGSLDKLSSVLVGAHSLAVSRRSRMWRSKVTLGVPL